MNIPQYGELASSGDGVPVCYRHPDRVSYVKCQQCGRNICPECQRPAAVGVQCPECFAREQADRRGKATRRKRSYRAVTDTPFVTYTIIAVCCGVFFLQLSSPNLTAEISFVPNLALEQPWRAVTGAFAHDTGFIMHILFNMYALWIVGRELEIFLGHARFAMLYFISLFGGALAVLLWSGTLTQTIGASGAIFGLFGALLVAQKASGGSLVQVGLLIVLNLVIGFMAPNISWQGHVGGLAAGIVAAVVMVAFSKNPTVLWIVLALIIGALAVGYYSAAAAKGYPLSCIRGTEICYDRKSFYPRSGTRSLPE